LLFHDLPEERTAINAQGASGAGQVNLFLGIFKRCFIICIHYGASNDRMVVNDELVRAWWKELWPVLRQHLNICLNLRCFVSLGFWKKGGRWGQNSWKENVTLDGISYSEI
jgi:hypothetical protein